MKVASETHLKVQSLFLIVVETPCTDHSIELSPSSRRFFVFVFLEGLALTRKSMNCNVDARRLVADTKVTKKSVGLNKTFLVGSLLKVGKRQIRQCKV